MKRNHWVLMLLCCLIPLAGIAATVFFRVPTSSVLYVGLMLMCPLLHLLMMRSMGHDPLRDAKRGHTAPSTVVHRHGLTAHGQDDENGKIVAVGPGLSEAAPGRPPR